MESSTHRFDLSAKPKKSIIKVIGVGGGGSNAVNSMYKHGIQDVAFVVCNTDEQALKSSPIQHKLQIGINLTSGLGAGANPEVGKNAAIESKEEIEALLNDGTKMLFVTAGMGGGTGTGAAPVIASIANKLGILTVGIVTLPFGFEGKRKLLQAQAGIKELRQHCDTVLVILNDRLREVLGNLSIGNAFAQADNVLTTAAKSIAEIITVPGYVNVDFEDVKTVMKKAGAAVMGSAQAEGKDRARKAAELALTSPLLDYKDIHGAKKILLSIVSGQEAEMHMDELAIITDYIQEKVGEDAEMIFGHGSDKQLKESIRVTVIATGFDEDKEVTTRNNTTTKA
ncbi:MAG: cell division protein FtsZ, partial [Candidatus Amoebophilus sp.]